MDHALYQRISDAELTDAGLTGSTVYGPENETVGTVAHVHGVGPEALVTIDVGGFRGICTKSVALWVSEIDFLRNEDGDTRGVTRYSKAELREMPEHHQ